MIIVFSIIIFWITLYQVTKFLDDRANERCYKEYLERQEKVNKK